MSVDFKKNDRGGYSTDLRELEPLTEQGHAPTEYLLGVMYIKGQGVPQDYKTAVKWYTRAAEQGDASAQNNLGLMYANGRGVKQDNIYARMWFNIAVSQENKNAIGNRLLVAREMTPSQLDQAKELAQERVKKIYKGC